jgi:hypothetical protein
MGRNRRQQRLQQRRRERTETAERPDRNGARSAATEPPRQRKSKPAWRHTIDQWGGIPMVGGVLVVIVVLGVLVWQNLPEGVQVSDGDLMGDPVPMTSAAHIDDAALMDIQPGLPPAGGPHFGRWLPTGFYEEPQQDGLIVHSLEHGVIWFSYNPDLISEEDLEVVRQVQNEFSNDVIASPRMDNSAPLFLVSWGQRLEAPQPVSADLLRDFVRTNRNRSPEPGVR